MSKRELIDAIRQHNRTVAPEFLAHLAESDLKAYLTRVTQIMGPSSPGHVTTTVDAKQELVLA